MTFSNNELLSIAEREKILNNSEYAELIAVSVCVVFVVSIITRGKG